MSQLAKSSALEKVAVAVSTIVIVVTIVYWILQVQGVFEELKLAGGG